jgi:hypothetical protein
MRHLRVAAKTCESGLFATDELQTLPWADPQPDSAVAPHTSVNDRHNDRLVRLSLSGDDANYCEGIAIGIVELLELQFPGRGLLDGFDRPLQGHFRRS